jgi:hypothetical protein
MRSAPKVVSSLRDDKKADGRITVLKRGMGPARADLNPEYHLSTYYQS